MYVHIMPLECRLVIDAEAPIEPSFSATSDASITPPRPTHRTHPTLKPMNDLFSSPGGARRRRSRSSPDPIRPTTTHPGHRSREKSSRRSPSSRKQQLAWTLLSALAIYGVWYFTPISQWLVDVLLELVPLQADLELGREAYFRDTHLSQDTYHDPRWTRRVQRIGQQLVESSHATATSASSSSAFATRRRSKNAHDYQWDFGVVKDDNQINALCLPGGIVRVTSGLLHQLDLTDGELAALLGHEMGHVLHRHGQARLLQRRVLHTIMEALVYDDRDDHEESLGEAIGELLIHSADWLGQQSFSRANEYEADETSWELLMSTYNPYHPHALQRLLTKLWEATGKQGGKTSWDSTHPGTLDRIQALEDKWKNLSSRERQEINRKFATR